MDTLANSKDRYITLNVVNYELEEFFNGCDNDMPGTVNICILSKSDWSHKFMIRIPYRSDVDTTLVQTAFWLGRCHSNSINHFVSGCEELHQFSIEDYRNNPDRLYEKLCWYLNKDKAKIIVDKAKLEKELNSKIVSSKTFLDFIDAKKALIKELNEELQNTH